MRLSSMYHFTRNHSPSSLQNQPSPPLFLFLPSNYSDPFLTNSSGLRGYSPYNLIMTIQQNHHQYHRQQLDEEEGRGLPQTATAKTGEHRVGVRLGRGIVLTLVILILVLVITALVLALTVFKVKQPRTQLLLAVVDGVAPRLTLPVLSIQLNITLDLRVKVENRNHVSFRHGPGESALLYRGVQVGEAELYSGTVPARGSTIVPCRLTMQVDRLLLGSDVSSLIRDIVGGQVAVEARSRLPGKVSFLGIFSKHAVARSDCNVTVGFPDLNIRGQDCHFKTKF